MNEFVEVKTADLTGQALAYAVAVSEGLGSQVCIYMREDGSFGNIWTDDHGCYRPDQYWDVGGPLIDKHKVIITYHNAPDRTPLATTDSTRPAFESGETILIAVCRAIVASVLGETVSVPKELLS